MEEVSDLLQAWGLPELRDIFIKNEINMQALSALTHDDIKELIPLLGPRSLFLRSWKMWNSDFKASLYNTSILSLPGDLSSIDNISLSDIVVQDLNAEEKIETSNVSVAEQLETRAPSLDTTSTTQHHNTSTTHCFYVIENNSLLQLLKEDFETSGLLKFVGTSLDNEHSRNLLASAICKQILKEHKNSNITKEIYHKWSKQIKEIFPNERITTYYIPPCVTAQGVTFQARGKLISQLLNLRRKYQKQGVLDIKPKKLQTTDEAVRLSPRPLPLSVNTTNSSNEDDDIAWLKSSSDPWTLVLAKWKGTLQKRLKALRESDDYSVEQYFKDFPALQKPHGCSLLEEDFNACYPEEKNNFYLNFPSVKKTLIELLKRRKPKDVYSNDVIHLADDSSEEKSNLAAILSLPELINPSIIALPVAATSSSSKRKTSPPAKKKKVNDKKWKPSKAESREAFVTNVQDDSYLELVIAKRHQKLIEKGFTPQPYIIIVGPNLSSVKSYFVVVNPNTFYNCPNILASVDACFKLTWSLNLEYSPSSYGPWYFIQKGLYKLSSPYDKGSTSVESLLTDCNLSN